MVESAGTVLDGIVDKLLKLKSWKGLNVVQKQAVAQGILDEPTNFVVIAPTGSGKTGIAEIAILQQLEKGRKVIYTVPSHALIDRI